MEKILILKYIKITIKIGTEIHNFALKFKIMREILHKNRWRSHSIPNHNTRCIVILTGIRQTGKTTLAQQVYPDLRYINCDAPENREILREVHSANWGKSVGNDVIDEAQKEPSVFEKIKFAYDCRQIYFSILLGPSQILLLKRILESLACRVFVYESGHLKIYLL